MREHYTIKQAASAIGVSAQVVREWLAETGVTTVTGKDKRARYLTRAQVVTLATAHRRAVQDESDLAGLLAELEALKEQQAAQQGKIAALEARLGALERQPSLRPSLTTEGTSRPAQRATEGLWGTAGNPGDLAGTLPARTASAGGITRSDAARLVSARHGVNFNTAKSWPWPVEAMASQDAVMRWALGYVTTRPPHKRPGGWRPRCSVIGCPCHEG